MAGKSDIEAGRAFVSLMLQDKGFSKGLSAAASKLMGFGKGVGMFGAAISGLGGAVVTPLLGMVKSFADAGSEIHDMAQRTNMSVEALQELGYAAEQTGTSLEAVEKAVNKARKEGKSFDSIAAKIAAIQDPAKQSQLALEEFDKSGAALVPMIRELPELRKRFRELGLGMSKEETEAADSLGDAFADLMMVVKSVKNTIGASLASAIQSAIDSAIKIVIVVRDWVRQNKELFATVLRVGLAVMGIGAAITGVGGALVVAGASLSAFNTLLGAGAALFGALLSPIGLVVAAVAGLATWFATSTTWGQQMVQSLAGWFGQLKDIAVEAFKGIADALAAGNLALAAKVAWAGIKLEWLSGTSSLRSMWLEFKDFYLRATTEMVFDAQALWATFNTNFASGLRNLRVKAADFFDDFINYLAHINATEEEKLNADLFTAKRKGARANQNAEDQKVTDAARNKALADIEAARKIAEQTQSASSDRARQQAKDALASARAELNAARDNAAQLRKDKELSRGPEFKPSEFNLSGETLKNQVFGTFSAAAAMAGGSGESPTVKELRKANKLWHDYLKKQDEQRREWDKLLRGH